MSIKTIVEGIRSFTDLLPIAQNAKGKVSFWGNRYIEVIGQNETLHIDILAERVMKLIIQNPWDEETRTVGKLIAVQINRVYEESDKEIWRNPFTCVLVFLRTLPDLARNIGYRFTNCQTPEKAFCYSKTRWYWKACESYEDRYISNEDLVGVCSIFKYNHLKITKRNPVEECNHLSINSVNDERSSADVYAY